MLPELVSIAETASEPLSIVNVELPANASVKAGLLAEPISLTPIAIPTPTDPPNEALPAIAQISDLSTAWIVALPSCVRLAPET